MIIEDCLVASVYNDTVLWVETVRWEEMVNTASLLTPHTADNHLNNILCLNISTSLTQPTNWPTIIRAAGF